jgi:hypothetical protein
LRRCDLDRSVSNETLSVSNPGLSISNGFSSVSIYHRSVSICLRRVSIEVRSVSIHFRSVSIDFRSFSDELCSFSILDPSVSNPPRRVSSGDDSVSSGRSSVSKEVRVARIVRDDRPDTRATPATGEDATPEEKGAVDLRLNLPKSLREKDLDGTTEGGTLCCVRSSPTCGGVEGAQRGGMPEPTRPG